MTLEYLMNAFGNSSLKKGTSLDLKSATRSGLETSSLDKFWYTTDLKSKSSPNSKLKEEVLTVEVWSI